MTCPGPLPVGVRRYLRNPLYHTPPTRTDVDESVHPLFGVESAEHSGLEIVLAAVSRW